MARLLDEITEAEVKVATLKTEREGWAAETPKIDVADLRAKIEAAQERQREHEESKRAAAAQSTRRPRFH